jgi:hypothetical protein
MDEVESGAVLRSAKAGDPTAKEHLRQSYCKDLIRIASKAKYGGPSIEERLSAAWVGFWDAVDRYDPDSNDEFWAYARKFVVGEVVDCVHDWHQRGGKLETVDEREKRKTGKFFRPLYAEYTGIEKRWDDYGADADGNTIPTGNKITGWIAADDAEPTWDETRLRLSQRLARLGRRLGVPRECVGVDENPNRNGGRRHARSRLEVPRADKANPKKSWRPLCRRAYQKATLGWQGPLRPLYTDEHPTPPQFLAEPSRIRGEHSPLGIIGWLAKDTDRRAKRRFDRLGRRAYAHWHSLRPHRLETMMVMDWPPIEPRQTKTYSVSINTARTASDSKDWKDDAKRLKAAVEACPPMVWSERDNSGHWRIVDRRPKEQTFESTAALAA